MTADQEPYALLERVFREEAGRLTASLVRLLGDFDLAKELIAEAVVEALEHWPRDGVPSRPASWLLTTARRKGLDRLRRETVFRQKLELVAALSPEPPREADDRLRLIFTCCHPVLAREAQVALTLRAVVGLTTEEIARAFVVPEDTLAKRIVRAKRKIVSSGVPYRVPGPNELGARLEEVLTVIYLVFNEGYVATTGDKPIRRDLARDAEWLASLLCQLLPDDPEPIGLLALIRLHLRRLRALGFVAARAARLQAGGALGKLIDRLFLGGATDMWTLGTGIVWNPGERGTCGGNCHGNSSASPDFWPDQPTSNQSEGRGESLVHPAADRLLRAERWQTLRLTLSRLD